ncbi:MAG: hypothetical protein ACXVR1_07775 [Solirubrobacteraceae bacterium]
MSSRRPNAFGKVLRAVRRDPTRHGDAASGTAAAPSSRRKSSSPLVRRQLDSFRHSQGLAYWHREQR